MWLCLYRSCEWESSIWELIELSAVLCGAAWKCPGCCLPSFSLLFCTLKCYFLLKKSSKWLANAIFIMKAWFIVLPQLCAFKKSNFHLCGFFSSSDIFVTMYLAKHLFLVIPSPSLFLRVFSNDVVFFLSPIFYVLFFYLTAYPYCFLQWLFLLWACSSLFYFNMSSYTTFYFSRSPCILSAHL